MRVTAEAKELTRQRILEAAKELFQSAGFEATTTRDIAREAGIAAGTLFNYFPTKEAIVLALVMTSGPQTTRSRSSERHESLEESLFAYASDSLRALKPYRKYLAPVLDTALSPLAEAKGDDLGQSLRTFHLEAVVERARMHGLAEALNPVALQMYWTLYLGVLSFWTKDSSPKQEDTLALLDQSLEMFVQWLRNAEKQSPGH
jgi:AcrR family transcriptional regulator